MPYCMPVPQSDTLPGACSVSPITLARPWIDPDTANKVHFLPKDAAAETHGLLAHMDASVLPTVYGGSLNPAAVGCPGIPGEPEVQIVASK